MLTEEMVRLVVLSPNPRSTPSIYLSILIAYLEMANWQEAARIALVIHAFVLTYEESIALDYLVYLMNFRDTHAIAHLEESLDLF